MFDPAYMDIMSNMTIGVAYIGPGVGLQFAGYAVVLGLIFFVAIVMVLVYPIRKYFLKKQFSEHVEGHVDSEADEEADSLMISPRTHDSE